MLAQAARTPHDLNFAGVVFLVSVRRCRAWHRNNSGRPEGETTTGRHRTRRNAGGGDAQGSDEVHMLHAEVQRLEAAQSSSRPAPVARVGHSLSAKKRAQTAAVHAHEDGYSVVADALGLQLTVGRIVEELPPTYVAE
ncbi:hypothetical protein B0H10DRAFT_2231628 [Mycena sp. CBHHK59/15]|nr:hypothetical protein B0H10DRAFT_2231628 [Mycena sp. CBHHK59/15]